uniref:Caprin-1_dimer domain-containing protein n=1 Tax=Caenorhabditis tropicalis TaxID=1561998 RepID=A0A1I7UL38_9PELO
MPYLKLKTYSGYSRPQTSHKKPHIENKNSIFHSTGLSKKESANSLALAVSSHERFLIMVNLIQATALGVDAPNRKLDEKGTKKPSNQGRNSSFNRHAPAFIPLGATHINLNSSMPFNVDPRSISYRNMIYNSNFMQNITPVGNQSLPFFSSGQSDFHNGYQQTNNTYIQPSHMTWQHEESSTGSNQKRGYSSGGNNSRGRRGRGAFYQNGRGIDHGSRNYDRARSDL